MKESYFKICNWRHIISHKYHFSLLVITSRQAGRNRLLLSRWIARNAGFPPRLFAVLLLSSLHRVMKGVPEPTEMRFERCQCCYHTYAYQIALSWWQRRHALTLEEQDAAHLMEERIGAMDVNKELVKVTEGKGRTRWVLRIVEYTTSSWHSQLLHIDQCAGHQRRQFSI